jgi:hypothetical protein
MGKPPARKTCSKCGEEKPTSEFYRQPNGRDGLHGTCKPCYCARNEATRQRKRLRQGTAHIPHQKQCAKCGSVKPAAEFAVYRAALDGLGRYCRECDGAISRARRYGVPEDRVRLMAAAKSCEICGSHFISTRHQHFDHRHADGAVRGVLCFRCNGLIGDCLENPEILRSAARYLERTVTTDYRLQPYVEQILCSQDISPTGAPTPEEPGQKCQTKPSQKSNSPQA